MNLQPLLLHSIIPTLHYHGCLHAGFENGDLSSKLFNMHKILLIVLFIASSVVARAQCQNTVMYKASKTEYLNSKDVVENSVVEESTLLISPTQVVLQKNGNGADEVTGSVIGWNCHWPNGFKKGKTIFSSVLAKGNGEERGAGFTIEGRDGALFITVAIEGMDQKIRFKADTYQIKK
jgi:hypothetical protein